MALLCVSAGSAYGIDRVFLFPAGGANLITVIRAQDNSIETTITAPPGITDIIQGPTAEFYYILTRRSPLFQLKDEPEGERRSSCGLRGIIA